MPMQVFVKYNDISALVVADMESHKTLGDLKLAIMHDRGWPTWEQILLFRGKWLDADSATLSSLSIKDGSCVDLLVHSGYDNDGMQPSKRCRRCPPPPEQDGGNSCAETLGRATFEAEAWAYKRPGAVVSIVGGGSSNKDE